MGRIETTRCSGADCVEVEDIGAAPDGTDWFRVRTTTHRRLNIAVTGAELRAFLRQVKAGQFDDIARLERDTTVDELLIERDALLIRIEELEDTLHYDYRPVGRA